MQMTGGSRLLVWRALRAMLGGVDSGTQKIIKSAKAIFCIAALTLAAQPVSAQHHLPSQDWEFQPQQCSRRPHDLLRQLLCFDPDMRAADIALTKAYREKIAQFEPEQVDALRVDSKIWRKYFMSVDFGSSSWPENVRAYLKEELAKRLQFVLTLPTDQPKAAYLFSATELGLLRIHAGQEKSLLDVITIIHDAMTLGVRRVFAAMVPHKSDGPVQDADSNSESSPLFTADDFLNAGFNDSAYLEYGRYFVDKGFTPHDGADGGMFIVDLETGETALAFTYADPPGLVIWEKACASPSFREESEALFRKYETASVAYWQFFDTPKKFDALIGEVVGEIHSTPCN